MKYSKFKVMMLAFFGPRFGLQKQFESLNMKLQIELIQARQTMRIMLFTFIAVELLPILFFGNLVLDANFPVIYFLLIIFCFAIFFGVLCLISAVSAFWSNFDSDKKKKQRDTEEEKLKDFTNKALRNWQSKCNDYNCR